MAGPGGSPEGGPQSEQFEAAKELEAKRSETREPSYLEQARIKAAEYLEAAREKGGQVYKEAAEFAKPYIKEGRDLAIDAGREAYLGGGTYYLFSKCIDKTPI